jgi:hypothetical protein
MPKERPEDHQLDEGQFPRLNQMFYRSEPADYFERRLNLLTLQAGNWDGIGELLKAGVTVGKVRLTTKDDPEDADPERVASHYTATEAVLLSHQIGETLLRLYLAHAFSGKRYPACPRLDLARLRHGAEFRDKVESRFVKARFDNSGNRQAIANVFHRTYKRELFGPKTPRERAWNESLRLHEQYLRYFAHQYLDGAGLYNAAKHGLALSPQETAGVSLEGIAARDGPAILYLTLGRTPSQPIPRWQEVLHWVDADQEIALIYRAITQIRMLWAAARHRYVTPKDPSVPVGLLFGPSPEEIIMGEKDTSVPMIVSDFKMHLRYWKLVDDPPAEANVPVETATERVHERLDELVPAGLRLLDPEPIDGGWRLALEELAHPGIAVVGVWDESLDRAIETLAGSIRGMG